MVFSASAVEATVSFGDAQYYLKRQVIYGIAAVVLMFVAARVDYHRLRPITYPILALVTLLLLACVAGFGHSGGGATRWLRLGPVHIQPSEMAKLALVLWLAYSLAKKRERVKSFSVGMLPHLLMAGGLMLLCLRQPDFGGAIVLLFLTFTLLFVAGARLGYLLGVGIVGSVLAAWLIRFTAYQVGACPCVVQHGRAPARSCVSAVPIRNVVRVRTIDGPRSGQGRCKSCICLSRTRISWPRSLAKNSAIWASSCSAWLIWPLSCGAYAPLWRPKTTSGAMSHSAYPSCLVCRLSSILP